MSLIKEKIGTIESEIHFVLRNVDEQEAEALANEILRARTTVVCGAGRVGMALRAFAMRLGHLGLASFTLGDSTVPSIGEGDMLLIGSGSGETQTIYDVADLGKKRGARIGLVTGNPGSRIGRLADTTVCLHAPTKTNPIQGFKSAQPMTSLYEQCLGIFLDALVLKLMDMTGQTHESMWERHSNLE